MKEIFLILAFFPNFISIIRFSLLSPTSSFNIETLEKKYPAFLNIELILLLSSAANDSI